MKRTGALFECVKLIRFDVLKSLMRAAGPADLDEVNARKRSQPEVRPEIALRQVASPALNLTELSNAVRPNSHTRSNCIAIAPATDELDTYEMVRATAVCE